MAVVEETFQDWALARRVNEALWRLVVAGTIQHRVFARARNGVVILEGKVRTEREKNLCTSVAITVPEVWTLWNNLTPENELH
jgi:osmotically-inducible protein OsmY